MRVVLLWIAACVGCGGVTDSDGGGVGGSGGVPSNGGACWDRVTAWELALRAAKACNLLVDEVECTELVPSHWRCGCDTFAGSTNQSAIQHLAELKQAYVGSPIVDCDDTCTTEDCVNPSSASCQSIDGTGGAMGRCVDVF